MIQNQLIQVINTKRNLEKSIKSINVELEITREKSNMEIKKLEEIIENLQSENINVCNLQLH